MLQREAAVGVAVSGGRLVFTGLRMSEREEEMFQALDATDQAVAYWLLSPAAKEEAKVAQITPQLADFLIERNRGNRKLSEATVKRYESDMLDGRWLVGTQGIGFDTEGRIVNGQHRLVGCSNSGVSFRTFIMRGLDPRVFAVEDRGRTRTTADNLTTIGFDKYRTEIGAAVSMLVRYPRGKAFSTNAGDKYVNMEAALEFAQKNQHIVDSARMARSLRCSDGKKYLMPPRLGTFFHYKFSDRDPALCEWFFERLRDGTECTERMAVLHLRRRLDRNALGTSKLPDRVIAALTIKAWNAHRRGKSMKSVRWDPAKDRFPEIR